MIAVDNYDLASLALKSAYPDNELIYDDVGEPSVMVRLHARTLRELGMGDSTAVHPAFIIDGQEVDDIYVGKYLSTIHNNRAYSLPDRDPAASINFDNAAKMCSNKGKGWHILTRMERGFLVRLMQLKGFFPDGNILYGKGADGIYRARPSFSGDDGKIYRTATGTGLEAYSHNNSLAGVADLRGDTWEWDGGIRLLNGEVQILPNNDGANNTHPQSANSLQWKAISCADGSMIAPDGKGTTVGTVKLDWRNEAPIYAEVKEDIAEGTHGAYFRSFKCSPEVGAEAQQVLKNLGMLMDKEGEIFANQYNYFDLHNERFLCSGGGDSYGANYGAASFGGGHSRFHGSWSIGFRCAFIKI